MLVAIITTIVVQGATTSEGCGFGSASTAGAILNELINDLDAASNKITDSTQGLELGSDCVAPGAAGTVCIADAVRIEGDTEATNAVAGTDTEIQITANGAASAHFVARTTTAGTDYPGYLLEDETFGLLGRLVLEGSFIGVANQYDVVLASQGGVGVALATANTARLRISNGGLTTIYNGLTLNAGVLTVPAVERCVQNEASSLSLGPSAPTVITNGVARGPGLANQNETLGISLEIPGDWDAVSDIAIRVYWTNTAGDAFLDTEAVVFDADYRLVAEGELLSGTTTNATVTYTQSGAGIDSEAFEIDLVVPFSGANSGDSIEGYVYRDHDEAADTYSGNPLIRRIELCYQSVSIPDHM